jgi:hypothetical protein
MDKNATRTIKTHSISGKGKDLDAECLAIFTTYIDNTAFQFAVTRESRLHDPAVTHRISGMQACKISIDHQGRARGDWKQAGKLALDEYLKTQDAKRIAGILYLLELQRSSRPAAP